VAHRNKAFYDKHKSKLTDRQKYIRSRYYTAQARAIRKGLDFNLTLDFIDKIVSSNCDYCGTDTDIQLDRKDNNVGYVAYNIVPACRRCNSFKGDYMNYEQMKAVIELLGWKHNA
jgi:hypothetical protein